MTLNIPREEFEQLEADAAKWRAAMREAEALKVTSLDTAKGAILSLVQQLEKASDERNELRTRLTHAKRIASEMKTTLEEIKL